MAKDKEENLDEVINDIVDEDQQKDQGRGQPQSGGPAAGPSQPQQPERLLPGVKHIIAVASGKGGVGKSTIAVNLAAGLARSGAAVGLLDTDIYGPSIPTMMGVHERPNITTEKKLIPIEKHGVRLLSMGLLVETDQATVWRGPMVTSAVQQFMRDAEWGNLDYMVLDLPPGTGDIQLTIVQNVPLSGAVVVSTPQNVALDDVRKAVAMFRKVNVPVLGILENMAYFTPPDLPDKKYYIFGKHGARDQAEKMDVPFLGEIPIEQSIRETSDEGTPIVLQDVQSETSQAFIELSNRVAQKVTQQSEEQGSSDDIEISFED